MQSLRQLGTGVIIAIVSVVLVVGGILLALAESSPSAPLGTPTQIPPTFPESFPTPTATASPVLSETPTVTQTATVLPTDTSLAVTTTPCTPPAGWIGITVGAGDTVYSIAQRYKTTAENLTAANCLLSADLPAGSTLYVPPVPTVTAIPCGPPTGWVKTYIVQPGDTLFRIALSYGITYPQLQRANCMGSSTIIYPGQRLWVPNVPTRTPFPGVTVTLEFPTSTNTPPPTPTTEPTSTATSTFTLTPSPTSTSTNAPP